ncbi:hypothetical protein FRC08_003044 [Ceratobasidium sp. 394]|nr:hypothetical protein FRC08_003044 [Ceratobasidium sp. 394]
MSRNVRKKPNRCAHGTPIGAPITSQQPGTDGSIYVSSQSSKALHPKKIARTEPDEVQGSSDIVIRRRWHRYVPDWLRYDCTLHITRAPYVKRAARDLGSGPNRTRLRSADEDDVMGVEKLKL